MAEEQATDVVEQEAPEEIVEDSDAVEVEDAEDVAEDGDDSDDQEEAEELAEELDAAETDEEREEVVEKIRKLKLKVDGEEFEEELPFDATPEMVEYLTKQIQMAKMGQKRAQETADFKKKDVRREEELSSFLDTLKTNPEAILSQMGIDPKKFAEDVLTKEVELMEMSEEERKIHELTQELEEIKVKEKSEKEARETAEAKALADKYAVDFEKDLISAIDDSDLPNNPYVINKMIQMMKTAVDMKIPLSFAELVPLVADDRMTDIKDMIGRMSADDLLGLLHEDKVKEIVTKRLPSEKKKVPPTAETIVDTGEVTEDQPWRTKKDGNVGDFFDNLRRQYPNTD